MDVKVGEENRPYIFQFERAEDQWLGHSIDDKERRRKTDRVKVEGRQVVLETDMEVNGVKGVIHVEIEVSEDGEKLEGKWTVTGEDGTEYYAGTAKGHREFTLDLAGQWQSAAVVGEDEIVVPATFEKKDGKWSGSFEKDEKPIAFSKVSIEGREVTCEFVMDVEGEERDFRLRGDATSADRVEGKWVILDLTGQEGSGGSWTLSRNPAFDLAGTWNATSQVNGEEHTSVYTIASGEEGYSGSVKSDLGETDLKSVSLKDDKVKFVIPFGETEAVVEAEVVEGALKGEWSLTGSDGSEHSGGWKADRASSKD